MRLAIGLGIWIATITQLPLVLRTIFPNAGFHSPFLLFLPGLWIFLLERKHQGDIKASVIKVRPWPYAGFSDLFAQIHLPSLAVGRTWPRWIARSVSSFSLALFSGGIGVEGAAAESAFGFALARRKSAVRWSEQIRRTDASCALAGCLGAAFGAPLAGVVLAIELGIGGRTFHAAITAVVSYAVSYFIKLSIIRPESADIDLTALAFGFEPRGLTPWLMVIVIGLCLGAVGTAMIRFSLWSRNAFNTFGSLGGPMLFCSIALVLISLSGTPKMLSPRQAMEFAIVGKSTTYQNILSLVGISAAFVLILSSIGTLAVFRSVIALGVLAISLVSSLYVHGAGGAGSEIWVSSAGWAAALLLTGGACLLGVFLGTPYAAAIAVFEMSQSPGVLLPALVGAVLASKVRGWLKTPSWVAGDMERRGLKIRQGRVAEVMDGIIVSDAMVTDFESALEKESVSDLHFRLLHGRYPFVPIVNQDGRYTGLLTVDQVERAWSSRELALADSPLANLLEAKDLLYRLSQKTPLVRPSDPLSVTQNLLDEYPCIPVVSEDGKVVGLLFVHQVRLAYERAMAKKALSPVRLLP